MDLFNKLFNPLNRKTKNKKNEYQDLSKESKRVTARPPSDLLLYARNITGNQIQEHIKLLNDCRWIRADYTYPAFDDMNFIYKNKVFSVIIDIQDETGVSYLPVEYKSRQLYACKKNNLIPCMFSITVPNPEEPDFSQVKPKSNGWNLYNTKTGEEIIPEHLATAEKTKMSDWELQNLAVKYVMLYLKSQKFSIYSYQDMLEIDPQIWFKDNDGKKCWIVVRNALMPQKQAEKPQKINEIIRRCFKNDGYFAGIVYTPQNDDPKDMNLYRLGNVKIEFSGLEKIHSVI